MALILPLITPKTLEVSCVGNFFTKSAKHSVVVEGHNFIFTNIEPNNDSTFQSVVTLATAQGHIVNLYRIPSADIEKSEPQGEPQLDILCVHTRIYNTSTSNASSDRLYFKRFDSSVLELADLGTFQCDVPTGISESQTEACISVGEPLGSTYGMVSFSNGLEGNVHILDPTRPSEAGTFAPEKAANNQTPWKSFWIDDETLAVIRESKFLTNLGFVRVQKTYTKSKSVRLTFKLLKNKLKHQPSRILQIYPVPSPGQSAKAVLLIHQEAVVIGKISNNSVSEESVRQLCLPKKHGRSKWWALEKLDETSGIYVSSHLEAFILDSKQKVEVINFESGLLSSLDHFSGLQGYFISKLANTAESQLTKLVFDKKGKRVVFVPSSAPCSEFDDVKLLSHAFNPTFGSEFVATQRHQAPGSLLKTRRYRVAQTFPLSLPYVGPINGVWVIDSRDDVFLMSTVNSSISIKVNRDIGGVTYEPIAPPSWVDSSVSTIFADRDVQVTADRVRFARPHLSLLKIESPVAGASDDDVLVLQTAGKSLVVRKADGVTSLVPVDNLVIAVSVREGIIAILESKTLTTFRIDEKTMLKEISKYSFSGSATCMAQLSSTEIMVGFTDGSVRLVVAQRDLCLSSESIQSLVVLGSPPSVLVTTASEVNIFNPDNEIVERCLSGGWRSWALSTVSLVGIRHSSLEAVLIDNKYAYRSEQVSLGIKDNSHLDISIRDEYAITLNTTSRQIAFIDRSKPSANTFVQALPALPSTNGEVWESQLFLHDKYLVEVSHAAQASSDDGDSDLDEDDDEDDDNFHVQLKLVLYQVDFSAWDKIVKVQTLCSKSTSLEGDPYDEIIVKFLSPRVFAVFTHSVEYVPVYIKENFSSFELGKTYSADTFVYDDHWIYDESTEKTHIVNFSGSIYDIPAPYALESLESLEPPSSAACIRVHDDDMVFDVVQVEDISTNPGTSFAALLKQPNNKPVSDLVLFRSDNTEIISKECITIPSRDVKLLPLRRDHCFTSGQNEYAVHPQVAVGTSRGAIYLVFLLKDEVLLSNLGKIQSKLHDELQFIQSRDSLDAATTPCIDGALMLEALQHAALHDLFREEGVDPEALLKTLSSAVF